MTDVSEILVHWYAGRSLSTISTSLGVDRKTIRKYLAPAIAAGMAPGGPPVSAPEWAALIAWWFPALSDTRLRQVTWGQFDGRRDWIVAQLQAGVTAATIHQRLRDEHGVVASVASFRRWLSATVPGEALVSRVTVLGPPGVPGEAAQVDWGLMGTWTDPAGGKRHRVWAFVMVLAFSRLMFTRPVLVMDQAAWTACHVAAFAYFGGVPARLVIDNLKTGVDKPDLYDPKLNRAYAEMAAHYGVLIDPARAIHPKDKPRVERPMPYVRDSFWRGRDFISLAAMQSAAVTWCTNVANARSSRALDGASPRAVFDAGEAARLTPLPARAFELAVWSVSKVGPDIHVKVGRTLYSVPFEHIGERVSIRATATTVQIFDQRNQLIATHIAAPMGKVTDMAHYPPEKIAFSMRTPVWCRAQAAIIGPACKNVIGELMAVNALYRLRQAQGVIRLADKYGPVRLEKACQVALDAGDPAYRTIKGLLAAGLENTDQDEPGGTGDGGAAAHLHGADMLFAPALFTLSQTVAPTVNASDNHRDHRGDER